MGEGDTRLPEVQRRFCIIKIVLMSGTMHEIDQSSLHPLVKHPENENVSPNRDRTRARENDMAIGPVLY